MKMASLEIEVVTEEIEKISKENGSCEIRTETVTEALVAISSKESFLTKEKSADSDVLTYNDDDLKNEKDNIVCSLQSNGSKSEKSQEQSACSQSSKVSSSSTRSSFNSIHNKSQSSSSSTIKDDEDSRSSHSSSASTIKTSQPISNKSDDESNSATSFSTNSRRSSPEKQSQNESTFKRSQSVNTNLTEDNDSRSSIVSSNSRSTTKNSQPMDNKSDDETRSSVKNIIPAKDSVKTKQKKYFSIVDSDSEDEICVPSKSGHDTRNIDSNTNESKSQKTVKKLKSKNKNKVLDSDSDEEPMKSQKERQSDNDKASNNILTIKNGQSVNDKSDEENSRSSFQFSRKRTSPEKESENESTFKRSQSVNTNLTEDNDSRSSIVSSNSRSTTKNSQPTDNKSDDETRSSVKNIEPAKDSVKTKQKKYLSIVDSDSEDEIFVPSKSGHDVRNIDSDTNESKSQKTVKKSKIKNKSKVLDSDSDEESTKSQKIHKNKQSDSDKSSTDSEKEESKPINKSNKISSIVDSDSESDSNHHSEQRGSASSGEENDTNKSKTEKKKSEKKRVGSVRASKDAAMQQIYSETQRLMREQELSLPYHRPKQRTLKEFLSRKKITSVIPKNLTCAEKVKMFPEVISKVVEEKEKEAEIFYQSSDSEEDEKQDEVMEIDQISIKNTNQSEFNNQNFDKMNIGDTQKLTQDNIQEFHNKREILQQRSLEFGVPRKLFMEDAGIMEETEKVLTSQNCLEDENDLNTDDVAAVRKKNKETKAGLRESSIPRKLFAGNTEEMDIDMDVDIDDASTTVPGAELEETVKTIENSEKKVDSVENETTLNNSNEDIVLNMSETEFDSSGEKKLIESNNASKLTTVQNKDEESIMIAETPIISHKDPLRSNRSSLVPPNEQDTTEKEIIIKEFNEIKDSEDPILKLNAKNSDEEILDSNALEGDFRLPPELEEPKKPSLKEQILANALKTKPRIKALPGQMIDFTDSGQMKEGVTRLLDRFARHSLVPKPVVNEIAEVKVIRAEGVGDDIRIVEEILPFKKTVIVDDGKKESKPGEKLKKLREDLKQKITTARNEEWRQKEENEQENEEDQESTKGKGDDFYEGLPDEEELLEDEESSESEPEEDDIPLVDKPRKKCDFGDEEAEESETEDVEDFDGNEIEEDDEEEVQEDNEEEDEEDEEDEDDEDDEDESEEEQIDTKPKKLKRIIKPFEEEDSDDPDSNVENVAMQNSSSKSKNADEDIFDSQASNDNAENDILPFQRERMGSDSRSQACKTPLPKANNLLNMISPVAQLTALNTSLDSAKKSASKTNNFEFDRISAANTGSAESNNRTQTNCSMEKMINLQKKLFEDAPEKVNEDELLGICSGKFTNPQSSAKYSSSAPSEVTDSQLMDLCSGAFGTQQISMKKLESTDLNSEANDEILQTHNGVTDSQLMELCSGGFVSQSSNAKKLELTNKNLQLTDETSQDITLTLDDDEDSTNSPVKPSTSVKKSDESMFSSDSKSPITLPSLNQAVSKNPMEAWLSKAKKPAAKTQQKKNVVTDSELMDLCSGTFTTQIADMKELGKNHTSQIHDEISQDFQLTLDDNSNSPVKKVSENCQLKEPEPSTKQSVAELEVLRNKFTIASSSDEDEDTKIKKKRTKKKLLKKKKVQKLQLSDDDDEEQNEFSEAEESEEYEEDEEEKFVDYDSEENEVVVVPKKEIKKVAAKFLENEAELSESDWDSADEDEQGLDKLDFEEADAEDIDEAKMKVQLDKIHMKQVMDDDQREVRMLQELLFDDGDLHSEGAGRERKFKWKNIDTLGDNELGPTIDDAEAIDDDVDSAAELQIRKMRYEQHKFLKDKEEKQIDPELENDLNDSPLTKFGLKIVSVRSTSKTIIEEKKLNKSNSDGAVLNNDKTKQFKRTLTNTTKLSFSNMRGSFLSRGDETLVRIAQNLQESNKLPLNAGRKGKFVFEHISPSVKDAKEEIDQENDNTPTQGKNNRKRKIFASQTPRTTKKPKVDDRAPGKKLF